MMTLWNNWILLWSNICVRNLACMEHNVKVAGGFAGEQQPMGFWFWMVQTIDSLTCWPRSHSGWSATGGSYTQQYKILLQNNGFWTPESHPTVCESPLGSEIANLAFNTSSVIILNWYKAVWTKANICRFCTSLCCSFTVTNKVRLCSQKNVWIRIYFSMGW